GVTDVTEICRGVSKANCIFKIILVALYLYRYLYILINTYIYLYTIYFYLYYLYHYNFNRKDRNKEYKLVYTLKKYARTGRRFIVKV
ncbi:unnamed protein product, partial [marine sediment metagenome]